MGHYRGNKQGRLRMAESVSFKVVLKDENEWRRFVVDKEVSTSFSYLQEKMSLVFPLLKQKMFTISWMDEDGDMVTIASDEELIIALTEMSGPVYKLIINIKSEKKSEDISSKESQIHPGIVCDGCEKTPIVGHRYKCVVCDDFDLCGSCEAAGCHPGHNMIRISNPEMNFPHRLFKRIHKMQERAEKRSSCQEQNGGPKPPFNHPRGRHGFRGFPGMGGKFGGVGGMRGECGVGAWAGPAFEAMVKGWIGDQETGNKEDKENNEKKENTGKSSEASKNMNDEQSEEKQEGNVDQKEPTSDQEVFNEALKQFTTITGSTEHLKNVGNFAAAALEPFGIDVQVHVGTPEDCSDKQGSTSSSSSNKKSDVQNSNHQEENESSEQDEGEWTVVAEKDIENRTSDVENPSKGNLYPSLEKDSNPLETPISPLPAAQSSAPPTTTTPILSTATAPTPSAPGMEAASLPATVTHPDPKIQVAVQAMMNMGFTNEGGWLANLLDAKNGDIGKVLDILQPVRK